MLKLFLEPIFVACVAIVFCDVLMAPGMILSWYTSLIDRIKAEWIKNPLGMCVYCFTGQLALWGYIFVHFYDYRLPEHVLFVFMAIFYTKLYYATTTH